ncbi:MAG: thioredoxin family protein [Bacilli bacterium]|nr:thioredoxin family protein [Bacilli bacterium]MBQ8901533.1 thioredoxin family protein [Bacilli bacterium]
MIKYLEHIEDYDTLVEKGILLVDFYTEWCGPCQMLASILEEIDYMDIIKVDADKFPELAMKYGIMSVPTLCFYKDGLMMQKEIGYRTPEEIKDIYKKISGN